MPTNPESPLTNTNWLSIGKNNVLFLAIHAQPAAKRTAIVGIHGDKLKVCLASPPVDGKANSVLIKFFAKLLRIPKGPLNSLEEKLAEKRRSLFLGCHLKNCLNA